MSMTLDEAILHAEEVASEKFENVDFIRHNPFGDKSKIQGCLECAAEHRQLAAWLRELQERRKAPEIVRCGECKHFQCNMRFDGYVPKGADAYECRHWCGGCDPMDYCSYGERAERRNDD